MRVLLSIRPEHVRNILSGVKRYEYRRKLYINPDVRTIVIYCTRPVGLLVAEFDVEETICERPDDLWCRTATHSGISREFFDDYFKDREHAYAIRIGEVRVYAEPIEPAELIENFSPPQSYMYLKDRPTQLTLPLA